MRRFLLYICILLFVSACRDDVMVVPPMEADTGDKSIVADYIGMYVLNEGNMGSNKSTLDYLDFTTGIYNRNIYPSRNPSQVKELGDVGNDIKIYGSKLWMVINCSNKVEVADAQTAVSQGHVNIPNCRFIAFHEGFAYISSYVGKVGGSSVIGSVYKVDTLTLKVTDRIDVGYQPEELVVVDGKLYVANSGGYNALQGKSYDQTVSVVDLQSFHETKKIVVAPNLFRIRRDRHGQLWVASRGDYFQYSSRLYLLKDDAVADSIDTPVADMAFRGDSLLYYGATIDPFTGSSRMNYGIINTSTRQIVNTQLIDNTQQIEMPYGMMVHPVTGDIYIMDATNYVSSGKLFCFDADGHFKWVTWTGDIPGHACFLVKDLKI